LKTLIKNPFVISGFRREADENCALLGCYAASSGNFLLAYRFYLQGPPLKMEPVCCPEMQVRNYHYLLRHNPKQRSSQNTIFFLKSI
jgi:hypothetical protein